MDGCRMNSLSGASLPGFWMWNVFHSNRPSFKGAVGFFLGWDEVGGGGMLERLY